MQARACQRNPKCGYLCAQRNASASAKMLGTTFLTGSTRCSPSIMFFIELSSSTAIIILQDHYIPSLPYTMQWYSSLPVIQVIYYSVIIPAYIPLYQWYLYIPVVYLCYTVIPVKYLYTMQWYTSTISLLPLYQWYISATSLYIYQWYTSIIPCSNISILPLYTMQWYLCYLYIYIPVMSLYQYFCYLSIPVYIPCDTHFCLYINIPLYNYTMQCMIAIHLWYIWYLYIGILI